MGVTNCRFSSPGLLSCSLAGRGSHPLNDGRFSAGLGLLDPLEDRCCPCHFSQLHMESPPLQGVGPSLWKTEGKSRRPRDGGTPPCWINGMLASCPYPSCPPHLCALRDSSAVFCKFLVPKGQPESFC